MSRRTIQSPGVEIREIDLTQRPAAAVGTSVFIAGFADQGPTDEIFNVGTFNEFQEIYGQPTNAAERYFYHSAKQVFDSDANVYVSRLPYGSNSNAADTTMRSALIYPVISPNTVSLTAVSGGNVGHKEGFELRFDTSNADVDFSTLSANDTYSFEIISKDSNDNLKYYSFSGTGTNLGNLGRNTNDGGTKYFRLSGDGSASDGYTQFETLTGETIVKGTCFFTDNSNDGFRSTEKGGLSGSDYFIIGNPTQVQLTETEYNAILDENVTWTNNASAGATASFTGGVESGAGIVVLNTGNTTINNNFEGYYVGIADNSNVNPATDFDSAGRLYTVTLTGDVGPYGSDGGLNFFTEVPSSRFGFTLSGAGGTANDESKTNVSKTLETFSKFDIDGAEFIDTINLGIFKVRNTPFANSELELTNFLAEGYTGSLNSFRKVQNENGGARKSLFLGDVDNNSPNVKILVNPYISRHTGDWTSTNGECPSKFVRVAKDFQNKDAAVAAGWQLDTPTNNFLFKTTGYTDRIETQGLFPLGQYASSTNDSTNKNIGSIPSKLDRIFNIASNVDLFTIDVAVEAGLGTVHAFGKNSTYTDTDYVDVTGFHVTTDQALSAATAITYRDDYRAIFNKFETFARQTRKDHIFIADVLRPLVVQGQNQKVLDDKSKFFSKHVYWPLRHQFGSANSNFATVYGNWAKVYDNVSDTQVWIPFSGVAAKIYANNDANFAPWFAPAGFNRGVVTGVNDIAISPTQRQRDQLYRIAVNPVTQFPAEGIVVFGQKTLQRKPTAFDRVNVRRLFLDLEKRTRETLKFFVFEPNTFLTRNRVVNTLTPIFENAKQTEGVYDYLIVCDDRNNPASVIDQNELRVDIYLKPVRAAEFILVNFFAVNTDVNFEEIVGQ